MAYAHSINELTQNTSAARIGRAPGFPVVIDLRRVLLTSAQNFAR
jgi:hypothetical protein